MNKINQNIGKRYYNLTILSASNEKGKVVVACDCGNIKRVRIYDILTNKTKSCGCLNSSVVINRNIKHGLSKTRIYKIWKGILKRCNNTKTEFYGIYGGRGISVCETWMDFKNFYLDMAESYQDGLSIDRIDNNLGYFKENCRWATQKVQANNKRNNKLYHYNDGMYTVSEISEITGVDVKLLRDRLYKGWDLLDAISIKKLKSGGNNRGDISYARRLMLQRR